MARFVGKRRVQRYEIGAPENIIKLNFFHANINRPLRRKEGIKGNHLHLQSQRPVSHDGADIAAADNSQGLVEKLNTHEAIFLPLAGMC